MNRLTTVLLFLLAFRCLADDTNIIVASDWSQPVSCQESEVRGRILILAESSPAYGGSNPENNTMMFVELQDMHAPSIKLYFDVFGLNLDLKDSNGKPAPEPTGKGWGGGRPSPHWAVLPACSTIRLFVHDGTKSPVIIRKGGEPSDYWAIPSTNTNVFYLFWNPYIIGSHKQHANHIRCSNA